MKRKWKIILTIIIILLLPTSLLGLGMSVYKIALWQADNNNNAKENDTINNLVIINEMNDSNYTEYLGNNDSNENNPYFRFIKMNLIDVNLNELKQINSDTIGWIQMPGTNINYPYVQTTDNDYYLHHSFYHYNNDSGWLYLDYRNDPYRNNRNMIIYGHGRLNGTMFGSLRNAITDNYFYNDNNGIIKLSNEHENTLWQVFSSYTIPTTNDYIQTDFASDDEFYNFIEMLKSRSKYNYNVTLSSQDQILTLSSCYNESDKIVVHAKLIKREIKSN